MQVVLAGLQVSNAVEVLRIGLLRCDVECLHGVQLALQLGFQGSLLLAQGTQGFQVGRIGLLSFALELAHGLLLGFQCCFKCRLLLA
ncbi:hypothetical protein D3C76_1028960 [compost metagenome]